MDFLAAARRQMLSGQVNDARERLLSSIEGLSADEMLRPGAQGDRSVRDILCNITAWDRATSACFRNMVQGERHPLLDMDDAGVEAFEQENVQAARHVPPEAALEEMHAAREELVALLRDLSNEQLFAPAPGDEHADMSIAACLAVTANLDEESAEAIEGWTRGTE